MWSSGGGGGNNGSTTTAGRGLFASVKLATAASSSEGTREEEADPVSSANDPAPASSAAVAGFGSATAKNNGGGGFFGSGFGKSAAPSGFGALRGDADDSTAGGDARSSSSYKSAAFGGGFAAASLGFGTIRSASSSAPFGFGPASSDATPPRDAAATSGGDGGGDGGSAGIFVKGPGAASDAVARAAPPSKFPTSSVVDTANGEQDEDCVCQVRARLFKMVPEDEKPASAEDGVLRDDVPCVPSTHRNLDLVMKGKEENDGEDGGSATGEAGRGEGEKRPKLVQKEAGIGPVRILRRKPADGDAEQRTSARIVQRQETSGGGAFRVILNVALSSKSCTFNRRGDKFVQLNALNNVGVIESFLFKVKTTADADTLERILMDVLEV
ncbi:hypothetical protein ACHAW5_008197 [Stephanodiscus triporus]|uniref:RanBD1 domain-containing protein n=1 Tax=Stephanodiscus triporus TaxID=2934178 RepID=A0ABD3MWC1_9STRA